MSLKKAYDVVVVGGGVVGMSAAFHLAERAALAGGAAPSVLVVERDCTYARASSALSASGVRQQFSTAENIRMSLYGASFVRDGQRLAVDPDDVPDMQLVEQGYLFLSACASGEAVLRENTAVQLANGAHTQLMSPAELQERYPWLNVSDVTVGALGTRDEGWFDPWSLLQALKRKSVSLGVDVATTEVVGISRSGTALSGVRLADGSEVGAGAVVNAAGAWAGQVMEMAGVAPMPVVPRKRCVFSVSCPDHSIDNAPLLVDPCSGAYFRPEGRCPGHFICGVSPAAEDDPDCAYDDPLQPDCELFEDVVWPALAERVPAFEELRLESAWAGFYEYMTLDQNAIIGRHPEVPNLLLANGFSGHGVQQGPAAGRAVSELLIDGQFSSLDLSAFALERVAEGRPVVERNVV